MSFTWTDNTWLESLFKFFGPSDIFQGQFSCIYIFTLSSSFSPKRHPSLALFIVISPPLFICSVGLLLFPVSLKFSILPRSPLSTYQPLFRFLPSSLLLSYSRFSQLPRSASSLPLLYTCVITLYCFFLLCLVNCFTLCCLFSPSFSWFFFLFVVEFGHIYFSDISLFLVGLLFFSIPFIVFSCLLLFV